MQTGFLQVGGHSLEYGWIAPTRKASPPLVFLHEGLGSLSAWRDFPEKLAHVTGAGALIYSRVGYGRSDALSGPRGVDFFDVEAALLGEVLTLRGIQRPILIGHSDGATIALLYAALKPDTVDALILEAAHVFVDEISVAGLAAAEVLYREGDLKARLARHHADPDGAFWGWAEIWRDPAFRDWNIEASLRRITCPVLAMQGALDEYGTQRQLTAIRDQVSGPVKIMLIENCGHSPHRDARDLVLAKMADFIRARFQADAQSGV
jgi:pimeloyl-ACP methyl ester carboxylesterase